MTEQAKRAGAIQPRQNGATNQEILQQLGMAKSTLWRWLKSEGFVETQPQKLTALKRMAQQKAVVAVRAGRLRRTRAAMEQGQREIGGLSQRDLWVLGVALYWAEGTKQKPHNIAQRVVLTNSDPEMVKLFVQWLRDICGIPREQLNFELCIHKSGNIVAAQHFWASALQVPAEQFRIRLKQHTVAPHRRNTADGYVGLVRVTVRRSVVLNRRIAGWIQGLCQSVGESANGKPSDFGSEYPGSIPGSPASDSTSLIHNFRV